VESLLDDSFDVVVASGQEVVRSRDDGNFAIFDSFGMLLVVYIRNAVSLGAAMKALQLMSCIRLGRCVSIKRSTAKSNRNQEMQMGGFREPMGHPTAVFGTYEHHNPDINPWFFELAQLYFEELRAHPVFRKILEAFRVKVNHHAKCDGFGIIPITPFTAISMTRNYQSEAHLDPKDGEEGSFIVWVDSKDDTAVVGGDGIDALFTIFFDGATNPKSSLAFYPSSGSSLWLRTDAFYHCSSKPEVSNTLPVTGGGAWVRWGSALLCRKDVLVSGVDKADKFHTTMQYLKANGSYSRGKALKK
jgi:hypothetical protein